MNPQQDILKAYHELDETTRSVADVAVLIFQPFMEYSFERFYTENVQRLPQYKIRKAFAELRKIHVLNDSEYRMCLSRDFLVTVFAEVINQPKTHKLLQQIEMHFPPPQGFSFDRINAIMYRAREVLISYFLKKSDLVILTEKLFYNYPDEAMELFCAMAGSEVYEGLITNLKPEIYSGILVFHFREAVLDFGSTTKVCRIADLQSGIPYLLSKEIILSAVKMYQGLFEESSEYNKHPRPGYSSFIHSVVSAYSGNYKESVDVFENGLKDYRKFMEMPKYFADSHFSVFYMLVLMIYKPGSHGTTLNKHIKLFQKSSYYDDQFMLILLYLANYQQYEATKQFDRFREEAISAGHAITRFIYLVARFLIHGSLTEKSHSEAILLLEEAESNGYRLFAQEIRWILYKCGFSEEPDNQTINPLLSRIERKEKWEESLDSLMVITSRTAPKDRVEKVSRLIYLVNFEEGHPEVQPVVQSYSVKGWSAGRNVSLKRLKENQVDGMTEQDISIASAIKHVSSYYTNNEYFFDFQKLLPELAGHPLLFRMDNSDIGVELIKSQPELITEKTSKGYLLKTDICETEKQVILKKETNTRYKLIQLTNEQLSVIRAMNGQMVIPEAGKEKLIRVISHLSSFMTVHSDLAGTDKELKQMQADSRIRVQLLPLGDGLKAECFVKPFGQIPPYCKPGKGGKTVYAVLENEKCMALRNLKEETSNADKLSEALQGIADLSEPVLFDDPHDCLTLLEILKGQSDIAIVEWPEGECFRIKRSLGFGQLNLSVKGRGYWFEMSGDVKVDENTVFTLKQLLELSSRSHGRFVELDNGEFLALTEEMKKRLDELAMFSVVDKDGVKINKFAVPAMKNIADSAGSFRTDKAWKDFQTKIEKNKDKTYQVPSGLQAELRPYQEEGFSWLARLADWDAGACLADDMGLGKTIQALALLIHRSSLGPALVICPASLVANWVAETVRFAPSLNIHVFRNNNRDEVLENLSASDLLIITYGLLQSETENLAKINWATVVLDEAHAIKNNQTKTSKAVMELNAGFRLILTGTPVQNHLGELWNLFNFINPGLLGTLQQFNQKFVVPVVKNGSTSEKVLLKKLISPFILRRTKSTVLEDLPPKTEITQLIELSDEETTFYEALRRQAIENIETDDGNSGQQHIRALAEITRLRLACCHPSLVDLSITSSKLSTFLDLVDELLENKHRALVFSQFIGHLSVIRKSLEAKKISYLYLDGSTPVDQRAAIVKDFQSGKGELFLISLKAGGLGLNLTSADYIIHLDPWWNPAIEDQASDRAHRIGQERPVTVYRLVAKGTIEEKIIDLHHTKRDMADSLLEGSDQSAKLTTGDLLKLLKDVE